MAIVPMGPFEYPMYRLPRPINGSNSKSAALINGASDVIIYAFSPDKTGTLLNVHVEAGTITTGGIIEIAIQQASESVNGPDAFSDGVDLATASLNVTVANTRKTFGPMLDASSNAITLNQGSVYNIQIRRASGSSYNGNFLYMNSVLAATESMDQVPTLTPNVFRSTTGGPTGTFLPGMPNCAIEYDDGSYIQTDMGFIEFFLNPNSNSISVNTTPDEIGNRFVPEVDMQVSGFVCYGSNGNAECKIYNSSDTVLVSRKTGLHGGTGSTSRRRKHHFASNVILVAGQVYRITLSYLSTSSTDAVAGINVDLNKNFAAFPGGINMYRTERTDGGAWTDTDSARFLISMIVNGIETTPQQFRGQTMMQVGSGVNASTGRIA